MKTQKQFLNFISTNRMKKPMMLRTLLASAVLCMSVAFVACQKSEVSNPSNVAKSEVENPRSNARQSFPNVLVFTPEWQCVPTMRNCTEYINVYGMANIAQMEDIFAVIDTQNTTDIINTFEENKDFLLNYIDEEEIDAVINQQLTVEHHYNSNSNIHFVVFKQGNTIDAAYPIQFVNE